MTEQLSTTHTQTHTHTHTHTQISHPLVNDRTEFVPHTLTDNLKLSRLKENMKTENETKRWYKNTAAIS